MFRALQANQKHANFLAIIGYSRVYRFLNGGTHQFLQCPLKPSPSHKEELAPKVLRSMGNDMLPFNYSGSAWDIAHSYGCFDENWCFTKLYGIKLMFTPLILLWLWMELITPFRIKIGYDAGDPLHLSCTGRPNPINDGQNYSPGGPVNWDISALHPAKLSQFHADIAGDRDD